MTLEEHCVWEKCRLRFHGYHQSPLKNSGCTFGKIDENVFGLFSDHMDLSLGSTKHVLGHIPQIDLGIQTGAWWLGDAGTTSASRPLRWRPGARMNHKIYVHTNFDLFCNIDSSTPTFGAPTWRRFTTIDSMMYGRALCHPFWKPPNAMVRYGRQSCTCNSINFKTE